MRSFNIDWKALADAMPLWRSLGEQSRRRLLQMKGGEVLPVEQLDEGDHKPLVEHGLMTLTQNKRRLRIAPAGREPLKALRAMYRIRREDDIVGEGDILHQVRETLTSEEMAYLLSEGGRRGYYNRSQHQADRLSWVESWLDLADAASARKWERDHLPVFASSGQFEDGSPYFDDEALFAATRRLVQEAMTWEQPVPIEALPDRVPDLDEQLLWRAVAPAIRYLLLFPRLHSDTLSPLIGLWPRITWLLHRPEPELPAAVEPPETYHGPFRVEDLTAVLVAAAASPLRMLASGQALYQKEYTRLGDAMPSLPPWLLEDPKEYHHAPKPADDPQVTLRIDNALSLSVQRGLLKPTWHRSSRKSRSYEITDEGRRWLELGLREQVKNMIDPIREPAAAAARGDEDDFEDDFEDQREEDDTAPLYYIDEYNEIYDLSEDSNLSPWMPDIFNWYSHPQFRQIDWRAAVIDALTDPDDEGFHPVLPWVNYHARVNNPLLGTRKNGGDYGTVPDLSRGYFARLDETMIEQLWSQSLLTLLTDVMMPVGGIEVGFDGERRSVRLNEIGRYMLGLIDDFTYEAPAEGEVIVQPDFEVLFMGPAPAAEARIAPLAERTGQRMGTMFRLTRKSVQDAAGAGITKDRALADLESISARPLPENVRRQLADWFDATASVKLREAWIVDAPDRDTADRVESVGGKQVRRLAPTTLEVTVTKSNQSALRRKLKDAGVFVK